MSRAAVTIRAALLVLTSVAVVSGFLAARRGGSEPSRAYVCPMHADVTASAPGTCPICGMNLEPAATGAVGQITPSSYLSYDVERRRAYGPDAPVPAWVDDDGSVVAIVYLDELPGHQAGQPGTFVAAAPPTRTAITVAAGSPEPWDRSTLRVRFERAPATPALTPGTIGWIERSRAPEAPVVPSSAVLEGTDVPGPYVLVASSDGHTLAKRPIVIGRAFGGMTAVVSGLRANERVLVGSSFFVDAARRLHGEAAIDVRPR